MIQGKSVVKTSTNNEKLIDEINWYKSVPNDLQDLIPKVLDSATENNPFVKLEYIKNPTLSELWIYSEFSIEFWKTIITDLFAIIQRFMNHKNQVTRQEYDSMYFEKTSNRIYELVKTDSLFKKIFDEDFILINK